MKNTLRLIGIIGILATCVSIAEAQQAKIPRIGYLLVSPLSSFSERVEGFRQGLRELGYVEGENMVRADKVIK